MKICLFTDNHWSTYSSLIRHQGKQYSARLENQILSLNWVESLAIQHECSEVICLGDFFDKPELTAHEISALQEIKWNGLHHRFLVGNHEMGINNLKYNSANIFNLIPNSEVISQPGVLKLSHGDNITPDTELCFLPYILESNRQPLSYYFGVKSDYVTRVIFSHNDIAGVQMGPFKTVNGFSVEDITNSCNMFLNGHIHNGGAITNSIINLGSLTGQNFSEDASVYDHCAYIFDTETLSLTGYVNPNAFNFYKLECLDSVSLPAFKANPVVTCKTSPSLVTEVRENLNKVNAIYRLITVNDNVDTTTVLEDLTVDHLKKFKEFIFEKLGSTADIVSEVEEIVK